jgi:hypothetical protein
MVSLKHPGEISLNILAKLLVYCILFLQFAPFADAGKFTNVCKKLKNCFSKDDSAPILARDSSGVICPNPMAPKDPKGMYSRTQEIFKDNFSDRNSGWGLYRSRSQILPTVQEIAADLRLCGIANDPKNTNVFYSFAANWDFATERATQPLRVQVFIEKNPGFNAKTINHLMPESWYLAIGQKFPEANKPGSMGQRA